MKTIVYNFMLICISTLCITSCDPVEHRIDLPSTNYNKDNLKFSVIQKVTGDNEATFINNLEDVLPYWSYKDAKGNELGHANKDTLNVALPFGGTYKVYYTAYTKGGAVEADPVEVNVAQNDPTYFTNPKWQMLTNGTKGKTWVLDMISPVGFTGLDLPNNPNGPDNWSWFPTYKGNEWVTENKDWGEMTFNLNGGYNVSVTQTSQKAGSTDQKTIVGTFLLDIDKNSMVFNGVEVLNGASIEQYNGVKSWYDTKVFEITENSLKLAVYRDHQVGQGKARLVYHYKPKP